MRAVLGLGSNLGDREAHLRGAIARLGTFVRVLAVSSFRETAPVGGPAQPDYLNGAVLVEYAGSPRALLEETQRLEREAGRTPQPLDSPRPLDIDLLLLEGPVVNEPGLIVPHARLKERRFALEPVAEIAGDWPVQGTGLSVKELLAHHLHPR
ncbi:MAG: 2-amino-4-hydroxy-6-hydroxymethyldihydropteridine diphosphokinase [Planctomycetaceae bacterium]